MTGNHEKTANMPFICTKFIFSDSERELSAQESTDKTSATKSKGSK